MAAKKNKTRLAPARRIGGSPPQPRKSGRPMDDFILTISDSDSDIPNLDSSPSPTPPTSPKPAPGKKRKRAESVGKGAGKADDGGLDSDFEFQSGDLGAGVGEYEGWGFEGAREAMKNGKRGVDIDEIIRRRKKKKKKTTNGGVEEEPEGEDEDEGSKADTEEEEEDEDEDEQEGPDDNDMQFTGFAEDDEDLAEDGFGMGASSEDSASSVGDESATNQALTDDQDSSNESAASVVPHPEDSDPSSSSSDESAAEAAKKAAYFAPQEKEDSLTTNTDPSSGNFQTMNLSRPILRGLASVGFTTPTLIQQKTIPIALLGKDVVGGAVTGSGKTAAFVVPILERLLFRPKKVPVSRVVILCPTRELAMQAHSVAVKLAAYTDIKFALAVGGLSLKVQEAELKKRPDVIVATPGRFIDHMRNSQGFTVDGIEIVVMDEADRMLEDGFADELNEIIAAIPKSRQTMLFSATMTDSVDKLIRLSLQRPVRLMVDTKMSTVKTLVQEFVRIRPQREGLRLAMLVYMCKEYFTQRAIVFFRSKVFAHRVRIVFGLFGLKASELHGSLTQEQRVKSIETFRDGNSDFLLATDLASRGLDIKGVDVVINYESPQSHEIYLHRVGRTARAGRPGRAVTLASESDRRVVKAAVKAAQSQSAKVVSRVLPTAAVDAIAADIDRLQDEIEEVLKEEKEEKEIQNAEVQITRGQNLIAHREEIKSRPRRTWFESQRDKEEREKVSKAQLNGLELPEKKVRLSNKKRKRIEGKEETEEAGGGGGGGGGRIYKKTRADRVSKPRGAGKVKGKKKGNSKAKGAAAAKPPKGRGGKKFAQKMARGKR